MWLSSCCGGKAQAHEPSIESRPLEQRNRGAQSAASIPHDAVQLGADARPSSALIPMELYPQAFRESTHLVASAVTDSPFGLTRHHAVEGPDGKIRRFPEDHGTSGPGAGSRRVGRTLQRDTDIVYDAPKNAIGRVRAEYRYNSQDNTLAYRFQHKFVKPTVSVDGVDAFALAGGKWMIPQFEYRACTYACEAMLLAEGKSPAAVRDILSKIHVTGPLSRRRDHDIIESFTETFGAPPIHKQFTGTNQDVLRQLRQAIREHGPGMLIGSGHTRILDDVGNRNGITHLTIRDPFHGSMIDVKDHEQFWGNNPHVPLGATTAPFEGLLFRPDPTAVTPTDPVRERAISVLFPPSSARTAS